MDEIDNENNNNTKPYRQIRKHIRKRNNISNIDRMEWEKYMQEVTLVEEYVNDFEESSSRGNDVEIEYPTEEECNRIIENLKQGKAAGPDSVDNEMSKNRGNELNEEFMRMKQIWKDEAIPEEWMISIEASKHFYTPNTNKWQTCHNFFNLSPRSHLGGTGELRKRKCNRAPRSTAEVPPSRPSQSVSVSPEHWVPGLRQSERTLSYTRSVPGASRNSPSPKTRTDRRHAILPLDVDKKKDRSSQLKEIERIRARCPTIASSARSGTRTTTTLIPSLARRVHPKRANHRVGSTAAYRLRQKCSSARCRPSPGSKRRKKWRVKTKEYDRCTTTRTLLILLASIRLTAQTPLKLTDDNDEPTPCEDADNIKIDSDQPDENDATDFYSKNTDADKLHSRSEDDGPGRVSSNETHDRNYESNNYRRRGNVTAPDGIARESSQAFRQDEIDEAVRHGLKLMHELYTVKEPLLYEMGLYIDRNEPAGKVAAFTEPNVKASLQAKYGYAMVQASLRLAQRILTRSGRQGQGFPENIQNTILGDQCPLRGIPRCPPASKRYRTADGTCNNLERPWRGSALSPLQRFLPPMYEDAVQHQRKSIFGNSLPSARKISTIIHRDKNVEVPAVSLMFMQWGQFLDHDVILTATSRAFNSSIPRCCLPGGSGFLPPELTHHECMPIPVPHDDWFFQRFGVRCMEFIRSAPASRIDCDLGWREQINQATSYVDGSMVYGSDARKAESLRTFRNGKLRYGRRRVRGPLNPPDPPEGEICRTGAISTSCFLGGDSRFGEQPALTAVHTIWLRFHNEIAEGLQSLNLHWSDEKIYQEGRKIISALIQHITYREFLPLVLGSEVIDLFELKLLRKGFYKDYNPRIDPSTANAFSTAAFRFGHSLVQNSFMRSTMNHRSIRNNVSMHNEEINLENIWTPGSLDRLILGLTNQPSQMRDEFISKELTNHLFQSDGEPFGMDLAAINIQRGRDHGIPSYTSWRVPCGLTPIKDWADLSKVMPKETIQRFKSLYEDVNDIDLYSGGLAEKPVRGGMVGPVFACIIAQQFLNYRKGDRFWYENDGFKSSFTLPQLQEIRKVNFAQVICHSLKGVDTIQPFVFLTSDQIQNDRVPCEEIIFNGLNLTPWREIAVEDINDIDEFGKFNEGIEEINFKRLKIEEFGEEDRVGIDESILQRPEFRPKVEIIHVSDDDDIKVNDQIDFGESISFGETPKILLKRNSDDIKRNSKILREETKSRSNSKILKEQHSNSTRIASINNKNNLKFIEQVLQENTNPKQARRIINNNTKTKTRTEEYSNATRFISNNKERHIGEFILETLHDFYDDYDDYTYVNRKKTTTTRRPISRRKPTRRPSLTMTLETSTIARKPERITLISNSGNQDKKNNWDALPPLTEIPDAYTSDIDNKNYVLINRNSFPLQVTTDQQNHGNDDSDVFVLHEPFLPEQHEKTDETKPNYEVSINIKYVVPTDEGSTRPKRPMTDDEKPLVSVNLLKRPNGLYGNDKFVTKRPVSDQSVTSYPVYILGGGSTRIPDRTKEPYVTGYEIKKTTKNDYDVPVYVSQVPHRPEYVTRPNYQSRPDYVNRPDPDNRPYYLTRPNYASTNRPGHMTTNYYNVQEVIDVDYDLVSDEITTKRPHRPNYSTKPYTTQRPYTIHRYTTKRPHSTQRPHFSAQRPDVERPGFSIQRPIRPNFTQSPTKRPFPTYLYLEGDSYGSSTNNQETRPIYVNKDPIDDVYSQILQNQRPNVDKYDNFATVHVNGQSHVNVDDKLDFKTSLLPNKLKVSPDKNLIKISSAKTSLEREGDDDLLEGKEGELELEEIDVDLPKLDGIHVVQVDVLPAETKYPQSEQNQTDDVLSMPTLKQLRVTLETVSELPRPMVPRDTRRRRG